MAEVKIDEAVKEMNMSKWWFYRLPPETPGVYRYGRALRINVEQLRQWMKLQCESHK